MDDDELDSQVQHLTCEFVLGRSLLKNPANMAKQITNFESANLRPLDNFEVIVPIADLKLDCSPIDIGGIRLFMVTADYIATMGIPAPFEHFAIKEFVGHSAAFVTSRGNNQKKVIERARTKIRTALNLLRLALEDHTTKLILWKIHDFELRFRDGESYLIRKADAGGKSRTMMGWELGPDRAITLTINDPLSKQSKQVASVTDTLFASDVQGDLYLYFTRAIEWLGGSAKRDSNDDKIVDLCVGLETLLATKSDVRKGELIALRYLLLCLALNKSWFDPGFVLYLYEKRSDIVHGSNRGIGTATDFSEGMMLAIETFRDALTYSNQNQILKHSKLLSALETPENLNKAIEWLEKAGNDYHKRITEAAKLLLNPTPHKSCCFFPNPSKKSIG